MGMLADEIDCVIGVDTHRERLALALVDLSGAVRHELEVAACAEGYGRALGEVRRLAPGRRLWAVEGAGFYGAGLSRHLTQAGERVVEVERPKRARPRGGAKSDPIDAVRAAREALARAHPAAPRQGEEREALRLFLATRARAVEARTAAILQVRSFVVSAPEELRASLRGLTSEALLRRCALLRPHPAQPAGRRATCLALRSAARRARLLGDEARALEAEIAAGVRRLAPGLLAVAGVGPIVAAQLLVSFSHAGRFRSEAAFASLAGVAPIPASSGQTVRHRLNRGGDRQLNRAIRVVVLTRMARCPATKAYLARRRAEGLTTREVMRCLMRHVARSLFRLLRRVMSQPGSRPPITAPTAAAPMLGPGGAEVRSAADILARLVGRLQVEEVVPRAT